MEKLILRNSLCPGDLLMLTAAVRDLHRAYPGRFTTDVRTPCRDLWSHNPHLTPIHESDPAARLIDCHYPLIHQSNSLPHHFIEGFISFLNETLGLAISLSEFRGDIHLSDTETALPSPAAQATGRSNHPPFWIIVGGGKYDFTIKWWHRRRWQAVVDHFRGRLQFVQVGAAGHYHPPLSGVTDLRGKTSLRDLIRLVYHSDGVVCPVTFAMHLAAAVPLRPDAPANPRPCVVVAGGREPPHWEAYPHHRFLHTVGTLPCCATGGCWKLRTVPLGDGDRKDAPPHLCTDVTPAGLPRCMDMITPRHVTDAIETYLPEGMAHHGTHLPP
ncbi:hypothetical protein BH23VER1_BH23VER1_36390 [soil metagenome]